MYERDIKWENEKQNLEWYNGFLQNPKATGSLILGNAFEVKEFRDVVLTVVGTGTVLVYGSSQKNEPDFNAPSTINNSWVLIALVNYSLVGAAAYYPGSVGAVVAGSTMLVEFDTNLLTWIGIHRSSEEVSLKLTEASTQ